MHRRMNMIMLTLLLLALSGLSARAADWTWEELVDAYDRGEAVQSASERLRQDLVGEVSAEIGEKALWEALWNEEDGPRRRAALGLALVQRMFPEGDNRRWEDVRGFWRPAEIPRSLAALDAVFVASSSLLDMEDEGARELALKLLRALSRSPRARYHALIHAPEEYGVLLKRIGRVSPPLPFDVLAGTLPLARPVRGWIGRDLALGRGVTFLDGFGAVAQGLGDYAWDRKRGRIYRVRERDRRYRWLIWD